MAREGEGVVVRATEAAELLVLAGEPIDEPMVAHGPFVMNTYAEIAQAVLDAQAGRLGR
jgi:redox-sensitive bicupin YhaK (pirin superfamily)